METTLLVTWSGVCPGMCMPLRSPPVTWPGPSVSHMEVESGDPALHSTRMACSSCLAVTMARSSSLGHLLHAKHPDPNANS
jgi:hypothetical protein